MIEVMLQAEGAASVDVLQALFASLDPTLVGRKFRNFAALDPASDQAWRFVALEDWLNDGIPLAGPVARELFFQWYGTNAPAEGRWKIGETVIDPRRIVCPSLVFIPSQDRIVPPGSAQRLADLVPLAESHTVDLGHIGMVSGGSAPKRVYAPVIDWLKNPPTP
jgi:polyhydroxyalkanoate synthase